MAPCFDKIVPAKKLENKKPLTMKHSKKQTHSKTHAIPSLRFEDQSLTSFSGLIIFQKFFDHLSLTKKLRQCFMHRTVSPIFGEATIVLLLIVHLLLGYRELRHLSFYQDDPMVKRLLNLKRLPNVATISRTLSDMDDDSVARYQAMVSDLVVNRLSELSLPRVTLDFDGSVISTSRYAEGTAVGFNRKKKGQRSYYPLFCTVAQTGQVLSLLHRSGNVHDSNGAEKFIIDCVKKVRNALPGVIIEVRMDGAFFSESIINALEKHDVEYTASVPFERLLALKTIVENRHKWYHMDSQCDYFELAWKPKSWSRKGRFVAVRQATKVQQKGPVQLDIFKPLDYQWEYKVIVTNKMIKAKKIVAYHNGRGSQESLFAELKSCNQMDYVPTHTLAGNQIYLISTIMAHNLTKELQMINQESDRKTGEKRPALWKFKKLSTIRQQIIQRAGRIIKPQGKIVLSMAENEEVKNQMLHFCNYLYPHNKKSLTEFSRYFFLCLKCEK